VVDEAYRIELLARHHPRATFSCGNDELDRYLRERALQDQRRGVAVGYVLIEAATGSIAGHYTLSSTALEPQGLPAEMLRRLPRYPLLPATLLGRLGRHARYRGGGVGPRLLAGALLCSRRLSREIASLGVVVDAVDEHARSLYERHGSMRLVDDEHRLMLPMAPIDTLMDPRTGAD
jgi:hypothetical protein